MTPGGALYSLTPDGATCSKVVLSTVFIQKTAFTGGAFFCSVKRQHHLLM